MHWATARQPLRALMHHYVQGAQQQQQRRPRTAEPPGVRLVHCCRSSAPHTLRCWLALPSAHGCGSSVVSWALRHLLCWLLLLLLLLLPPAPLLLQHLSSCCCSSGGTAAAAAAGAFGVCVLVVHNYYQWFF